jgi:hypothetical protein
MFDTAHSLSRASGELGTLFGTLNRAPSPTGRYQRSGKACTPAPASIGLTGFESHSRCRRCAPFPFGYLRHILTMLIDIVFMLDELVLNHLLNIRAGRAQIDDVDDANLQAWEMVAQQRNRGQHFQRRCAGLCVNVRQARSSMPRGRRR